MENIQKYKEESFDMGLAAALSPYQAPAFEAVNNKAWVPYLDTDKSQYPNKLIYYMKNSSMHGAILNNMIAQVAGNGFEVVANGNNILATQLFLKNMGSDDEDANDILFKWSTDMCVFNGLSSLTTWGNDGAKVIHIDHIDYSKIRSQKVNSKGDIEGYFFSMKWDTQRPKTIYIPNFNTSSMARKKKAYNEAIKQLVMDGVIVPELQEEFVEEVGQLYYFHPYKSDEFYYPTPAYVAATNAINANISASQYALGMLENGISANHIVTFTGTYDDNAFKKICRDFSKAYINNKRKGLPIYGKSDGDGNGIEVKAIPDNGKDQKFTQINDVTTQSILSGHGITSPMLVGLMVPGSLGGSDQIIESAALFYKNVIRPKQNHITKYINKILNLNGLDNVYIKRLEIESENNELKETENKK